jgi:predicted negative regulator of RcsB-dependent stress response
MWFVVILLVLAVLAVVLWRIWQVEQAELAAKLERQTLIRRVEAQSDFRLQQAAQHALQQMLDEARRRQDRS